MPLLKDVLNAPNKDTLLRIVDDRVPSLARLVDMGATHTTTPEIITCPRCGSLNIAKMGIVYETQQYLCGACHRKFNNKQTPFRMRTPAVHVGAALSMFYDGLSCTDVARQLQQATGESLNPSTVYRWVQKYSQQAIDQTQDLKAHTGKIWAADETMLGVRAAQVAVNKENTIWYWDVLDEDTRFLLASHFSNTRTIKDAQTLFERARARASTTPRFIVTDKLRAYLDSIDNVFGGEAHHVQSHGMASSTHNNIIERFHGTIKERTKVMRDLKSPESAALIMGGWAVHYNFFRPHMGLRGKTPAEAAGVAYDKKNWVEIVREAE